jgi:hypothetical protein
MARPLQWVADRRTNFRQKDFFKNAAAYLKDENWERPIYIGPVPSSSPSNRPCSRLAVTRRADSASDNPEFASPAERGAGAIPEFPVGKNSPRREKLEETVVKAASPINGLHWAYT